MTACQQNQNGVVAFGDDPTSSPLLLRDEKWCMWVKSIVISRVVETLRVKDKRVLFQVMRSLDTSATTAFEDAFFPQYGFTVGQFSSFHVLCNNGKKRKELAEEALEA